MSVYYQILQGVRDRIQDAVGDEIPVVVRRRPEFLASDSLPLAVVSPDQDGETIDLETFNQHVTWAYPVLVVLFSKGNRELSIGLEDMDLRETIRDELYQMPPLANQAGIYDLDLSLSGPFNLRNPSHTTETDAFRVIYKSSETRKA